MCEASHSMLNPKQGDQNYQRESCPRKVRIGFDTATLKRESTGSNSATLRLLPRCVLCSSEYEMLNIAQMLGLVSYGPLSQTKCSAKGCPQERLYLSTHCSQHLFQAYLLRKAGECSTETENARCLEKASVTNKKWTSDKNSRFELYLDTDARRRSDALIFVLDLEGLLSENHVKQAAAIDVDTKEVLFNLHITDDAACLRKVSPRKRHPYPQLQRGLLSPSDLRGD